jgi:hypothetical protein
MMNNIWNYARTLFSQVSSRQPRRRRARDRRTSILRGELLEQRCVLSAVPISLNAETSSVLIQGTPEADDVRVWIEAQHVFVNMSTANESHLVSFPRESVAQIRFYGGDGDDRFENLTDVPTLAWGGAGNDTLIGGGNSDDMRGGAGNDVFVPNRAIFRLADESAVPSCCPRVVGGLPSNTSCGVPANMRATIQFVDSRGGLLRTGLRGKHGLVVAKEVFVVGKVHQADNDRVLIVNATKMHVPQGDIPFDFMLESEPNGVRNVIDAKKEAKAGDRVSIRGRVGGTARPFVNGRAVFTIVGHGPLACSDIEGDHCSTPWDFSCTPREELRAHSATIQIVDDAGAPIRTDIKGRRGIHELSDLTIVGNVVSADNGALIVKAKGIYVNDSGQNNSGKE